MLIFLELLHRPGESGPVDSLRARLHLIAPQRATDNSPSAVTEVTTPSGFLRVPLIVEWCWTTSAPPRLGSFLPKTKRTLPLNLLALSEEGEQRNVGRERRLTACKGQLE